jgi:hypothetical protein
MEEQNSNESVIQSARESASEQAREPPSEQAQESALEPALEPTQEPTQESVSESALEPAQESTLEPETESDELPSELIIDDDSSINEEVYNTFVRLYPILCKNVVLKSGLNQKLKQIVETNSPPELVMFTKRIISNIYPQLLVNRNVLLMDDESKKMTFIWTQIYSIISQII